MNTYPIPTNPANDVWANAYAAESVNAIAAIDRINQAGHLDLRSYASNTISVHLSTTLDSASDYYSMWKFLTSAVSIAYDCKGRLVVRCYSDRYVDLEIHIGSVTMHSDVNPVYRIGLGQIYFNRIDQLETPDGAEFDAVQKVYALISQQAETPEAREIIDQRWNAATAENA